MCIGIFPSRTEKITIEYRYVIEPPHTGVNPTGGEVYIATRFWYMHFVHIGKLQRDSRLQTEAVILTNTQTLPLVKLYFRGKIRYDNSIRGEEV